MRSLIYVVFLLFAVSAYSAYFPLKETFFKDELKTLTLENATVKPSNPSVGSSKVYVKDGLVTLLGSDGVEAPIGGIRKWATATSYKQDDVVWYDGDEKIYRVVTAHTSGTFATDLSGGKLAEISATEALNHNDSLNKQGGTTDEYYHLTATQHNEATTEIDPIYIKNGGAELALSGWSCSSNVTITRNTTTPLEGSADFLLDVTSSAVAGNYCQYPFTATNADMITKMVTASVKAVKYNTTYNDGDIRVCVYDVTAAKCLRTDYFFDTSPNFSADFQIETNSSLALRFEVVTPSVARTLQLDGIKVESQKPSTTGGVDVYLGKVETTGSWTANTSYSADYWRVGDRLKAKILITLSGDPGTDNLDVYLPNGYLIDSSKSTTSSASVLGIATLYDSSGGTTTSRIQGQVRGNNTTGGVRVYITSDTNTLYTEALNNTSVINPLGSGDIVSLEYEVPIQGWSSNMVLSSQTSNREIIAIYSSDAGQNIPSSSTVNIVNFEDKIKDTHNAVTTGATWKFTAPQDDCYMVTAYAQGSTAASSSAGLISAIYVDGSESKAREDFTISTRAIHYSLNGKICLTRGQELDFRIAQQTGATNNLYSADGNRTVIYISNDTGSQTIAKDAVGFASYSLAGGDTINNGGTRLDYSVKKYDNGLLKVTTGASWEVECLRDGIFKAKGKILYSSVTLSTTQQAYVQLYKNTVGSFTSQKTIGNGSANTYDVNFNFEDVCVKGDKYYFILVSPVASTVNSSGPSTNTYLTMTLE